MFSALLVIAGAGIYLYFIRVQPVYINGRYVTLKQQNTAFVAGTILQHMHGFPSYAPIFLTAYTVNICTHTGAHKAYSKCTVHEHLLHNKKTNPRTYINKHTSYTYTHTLRKYLYFAKGLQ